MKNNKWSVRSYDDREMNVVLFISRNKDNKHVENFTERRRSFVTKDEMYSEKLKTKFMNFVNDGVPGEVCRMYFSVNSRDEDKIYKDLLHFLIDTPDFNLCSIDSKLAGIAAVNSNAKTKRWMFDFDIDDENEVTNFINDIHKCDVDVEVEAHKTPNGYAVITNRGFDTRELMKIWSDKDITLKRDDLLCVYWTSKQ